MNKKKKTFISLKTIYSPTGKKGKTNLKVKKKNVKYTSISLIYINFQTKRYFNATRINKLLCVLAMWNKRGLTLIITQKKNCKKSNQYFMNYLNHPEQNTFFFGVYGKKIIIKTFKLIVQFKKYNLMYWLVCKNIKLKLFIGYLFIFFFLIRLKFIFHLIQHSAFTK